MNENPTPTEDIETADEFDVEGHKSLHASLDSEEDVEGHKSLHASLDSEEDVEGHVNFPRPSEPFPSL